MLEGTAYKKYFTSVYFGFIIIISYMLNYCADYLSSEVVCFFVAAVAK